MTLHFVGPRSLQSLVPLLRGVALNRVGLLRSACKIDPRNVGTSFIDHTKGPKVYSSIEIVRDSR